MSLNPRERMFVAQISLHIDTFLSLISRTLSSMQTTQEVNPHPCSAPRVNMWNVTFLFLFLFFMPLVECWCMHMPHRPGRSSGLDHTTPHHTIKMLHFVLFRSVTCYTNPIVSRIHVNATKLCNIMCTLVAAGVILHSLECL